MRSLTPSVKQQVARLVGLAPWWLWVVSGLALGLRLAIVPYGLPYEFDPDERDFVGSAWRMIESGTLDPGWYGHPAATLMDALATIYAVYGIAGVLNGALGAVAEAGDAYRADVTHFFLIGRALTVITGVAVVAITYAIARELRARPVWAAAAALMLALSLPLVQYSSIVRADMLLIGFLLAVVLVMLRAMERPSGSAFAMAGLLLGLAVTSKYPGALGMVPILAANITLVFDKMVTPRRGLLWLGAAACACLITAVVVAPYLFVNLGETLGAIKNEARPVHLGATGQGPVHNLWAYLTVALPTALGVVGTAAGIAGLAVMLTTRRGRVVSLSFWVYLGFVSILSLWWLRWALPLVPLAAIGGAVLLDRTEAGLNAWRPGRWLMVVRAATVILLVLPLVGPTITVVWHQALNDDTRLKAIDWLHENVPDGSTILIDSYTTQVSSDRYDVVIVLDGRLVRWSEVSQKLRPGGCFSTIGAEWQEEPEAILGAIGAERVDYVVLTNLWIDLYRNEAASYPAQAATYEVLLDAYPVIMTFAETDAPIGWPIAILDVRGAAPPVD